ncbi:MAG TPA: nuclear transport factor 2 family protein [Polyangiaceae bacterium]
MMSNAGDEAAVRAATEGFYLALDQLLQGNGNQAMSDAWLHEDFVTTVHPFGHWARSWPEVWATWLEIEAVFGFYKGHQDRTDRIGGIHELKVAVLGDVAHTTSIFRSKMYLTDGTTTGLNVNCTNILHRKNGSWKLVHHHPDQASPEFVAAVQKMVEGGQR